MNEQLIKDIISGAVATGADEAIGDWVEDIHHLVEAERERIIKLLEAMRCGCGSTECPHILDAIELIKGENK